MSENKRHGVGVWCQICPVRDFCNYKHSRSCYDVSQFIHKHNEGILRDGDFDRQKESTLNCPLRKMFEEYQSKIEWAEKGIKFE